MESWHAAHPEAALQLNVTRHPYSFVGDKPLPPGAEIQGTWADCLVQYMGPGGNRAQKLQGVSRSLNSLGAESGITFDIGVPADFGNHYVDSQRLLLWAGRVGKQEEVMLELNKLHFSAKQSAGHRATLLKAAAAVGLDAKETQGFLDTDELREKVWASFRSTVQEKNIHSIPLFVFSVPSLGAVGGPFRKPGAREAYVVQGSGNHDLFLSLLEVISRDMQAGRRIDDQRSAQFRQDEWWRPTAAA